MSKQALVPVNLGHNRRRVPGRCGRGAPPPGPSQSDTTKLPDAVKVWIVKLPLVVTVPPRAVIEPVGYQIMMVECRLSVAGQPTKDSEHARPFGFVTPNWA